MSDPLNNFHSWPEHRLERVKECPICGSIEREVMYKGLTDYFFHCAPGEWSMYRCTACNSAYLNPRLTKDTIGLAYDSYFTHSDFLPTTSQSSSVFKQFVRRISNGYMNAVFKCKKNDASRIGAALVPLIKPLESHLQARARHLPKLPDNGGTLLDVGCGNGEFVKFATEAGWKAFGIDPDPKAIKAAKSLGLDACVGGIELFKDQSQAYDIITLSHVIEHVHNPIYILKECHRLLKPGGILWLETPNIMSYGHTLYGRYWRGLEPPRHLVIFSPLALLSQLNSVGFISIEQKHRALSTLITFPESQYVYKKETRVKRPRTLLNIISLIHYMYAETLEALSPYKREFLTIIAYKAE